MRPWKSDCINQGSFGHGSLTAFRRVVPLREMRRKTTPGSGHMRRCVKTKVPCALLPCLGPCCLPWPCALQSHINLVHDCALICDFV